ncbi:MAG: lysylphosphatidylglycerol synthase transmembrane domain-containing protein [Vulcanimicrobiota bacterium]
MSKVKLSDLLRLIFSLAVAAWAINWVLASAGANLTHEFTSANYGWIVVGLVLTTLGTVLTSYRWSTLLVLQDVKISQWEAFRLTMIGIFFNLFGLGGVGGDFFKMYYVQAQAGNRREEAILSIVVDRILGLLGLFVVALLTLPFVWSELRTANPAIQSMVGFVVLISLVGGGGVSLVLTRDYWLPEGLKETIKYAGKKFPARLVGLIARLIRSVDLYRSHLPAVFRALAISALVHSLATLNVVSIGKAFHVEGLSLRHYFLAVQVANTVSAVPITPSGLGSRDLVIKKFFEFAGADPRANLIPFGLSMMLVLWSLIGGIFFVFAKRSGGVGKSIGGTP